MDAPKNAFERRAFLGTSVASGVNKRYLAQYVAVFENAFNFKEHLDHVIRAMIIPDYYLEIYASP